MYLKALDVNGFKSFSDRTKLDFQKGITSIVGPNGSGKSNILDAILWVLGEQSYKSIRAKEGSDVIFSGGKNKKAKSMAEVSLIIDNSDNMLDIEYTEIKITRRIFSSGENEYFINNKRCRLKDIQELFLDTGIGKNAYSIIGQGKVERIIMSNPVEIRGIIEEAAGIKKYKKRKEEAEKKLDEVEDNIEKIGFVQEEVESNLKPLKSQSEKAKQYKDLKVKHGELHVSLLKREEFDLKDRYHKLEKEISELENDISEVENQFKASETELEKVNKDRENLGEVLEDKEKEYAEIRSKIEKFNGQIGILNERLSNFSREKEEKIYQKEELGNKLKKREKEIEDIRIEKQELEQELKKLKEDTENYRLSVNKEKDIISNKKSKYEDLKNNLIEIEIGKIKNKNELESDERKVGLSTKRIENLKEELEEFSNNESKLNSEIKELKKETQNYEEKIGKNSLLIEELKKKKYGIDEKLTRVEKKLDEENRKKSNKSMKLYSLKKLEENFEGFFKGVKGIINAEINGVVGPFISLIEMDEKLENAIQSAAGNNLQDIVVENSNVAKECIKYLKENRLGRASFLPFDTLKVFGKKDKIEEPGVLGWASDLVRCDEKNKKIVEFVLGNILVVENIDTGIKLVKKRNMNSLVVSLEGETISGRGKISGGEKVKSNMSVIFERKKEIRNLEEEIEILDSEIKKQEQELEKHTSEKEEIYIQGKDVADEIANLDEKKNGIAKRLFEKENKAKELSRNIQTINFEIEEETGHYQMISERMFKNKKTIDVADVDIDKLNKEIEELKNEISFESKEFEEREEKFKEKRMQLVKYEEKYFTSKSRYDEIESFRNEISIEIEKIEERLKSIDNQESKVKEEIKELSKNSSENEKLSSKFEQEILDKKSEYKKIERLEKEYIVKVKESENEIIIKKNHFTRKAREHEKIKSEIQSVEVGLSEYEDISVIEATTNKKKTENEIEKIKNEIKSLGDVNLLAIEEYQKTLEKYEFIKTQKDDLIESKSFLKKLIDEIEEEIINKFKASFKNIQQNFEYMCKEVMNGATGSMKLSDDTNMLTTGVELAVKFVGKKMQTLSLLSGGEKSMIAVAFVLSIFMYKPSPFTFFDEIEAALDEANTKKLIGVLRKFVDKTQFVLITHNKETMKNSDVLYGVTMNKAEGVSKVISVEM